MVDAQITVVEGELLARSDSVS